MHLAPNVFDVWAFQRDGNEPRFLLLHTATEKAERHFNGGRFWQIPSGFVNSHETIVDAVMRVMNVYGLAPTAIWAGEHAYVIYNRRFAEMQVIGVFAAEVEDTQVRLNPSEHSDCAWLDFDECLKRVHFRGLKDGLRSVREYITGPDAPAQELCLYDSRPSRDGTN